VKKLLVAVLLLVTGYMAATIYIGSQTGSSLDDALKQVSGEVPTLSFTPKQSQVGIFSSSYVYAVSFKPQANSPDALLLDLTFNAAHGPIPFAAGSLAPCRSVVTGRIALAENNPEAIRKALEQAPELLNTSIRTVTGLTGEVDVKVTVPPLLRETPMRQEFQGATISVTTDKDFARRVIKAELPLLNLQDADYSFSLKGLSYQADATQLRKAVWHGQTSAGLKSVELSSKDHSKDALLENLDLRTKSKLHDGMVDYDTAMGGVLTVSKRAPLPFAFTINGYNLDVDALSQANALLQRQSSGDPAKQASAEEVQKVSGALLARDPRLDVEIKAMPGGQDEVGLKAEVSAPGLKVLPPSLPEALPSLRAKADLAAQESGLAILADLFTNPQAADIPAARQQIQAFLQQFADKGFIVREGSKITSTATWDGKALLVNGKPLM